MDRYNTPHSISFTHSSLGSMPSSKWSREQQAEYAILADNLISENHKAFVESLKASEDRAQQRADATVGLVSLAIAQHNEASRELVRCVETEIRLQDRLSFFLDTPLVFDSNGIASLGECNE